MCDLLDIWLKKEIEHKQDIFNYLQHNHCSDEVVQSGLDMIANIDSVIKQIILLKGIGKGEDNL